MSENTMLTRSKSKEQKHTNMDDDRRSLRSVRSMSSRASSTGSVARREAMVALASAKASEQFEVLIQEKRQEQHDTEREQQKIESALQKKHQDTERELSILSASRATAIAEATLKAIDQCLSEEVGLEDVDVHDDDNRTNAWIQQHNHVESGDETGESAKVQNGLPPIPQTDTLRNEGHALSSTTPMDHASDKVTGITSNSTIPMNGDETGRIYHAPKTHGVQTYKPNGDISPYPSRPSQGKDQIPQVQQQRYIDFVPRCGFAGNTPVYQPPIEPVANDQQAGPYIHINNTHEHSTLPSSAHNTRPLPDPASSAQDRQYALTPDETKTDPSITQVLMTQFSTSLARQNIPKYEPDVFTGDVTLYYPWRNTFKAMLCGADISPTQELILMRKFTTKEPQRLVDSFRRRLYLNPMDALRDTWAALDDEFDNTAAITQAYFQQIDKAAKFGESDHAKLKDFANICADVQSQLVYLPGLGSLNYANVLQPVTNQIPKSIKLKWERIVVEHANSHRNAYPGFGSFADLVRSEAKLRTHPNIQIGKPTSTGKQETTVKETPRRERQDDYGDDARVFVTKTLPPKGNAKHCLWHDGPGHYLTDCPDFSSAPLNDKYNFVLDMRLCFRCLRSGHYAADCKANVKCDICGDVNHRKDFHPNHSSSTTKTRNNDVRSTCTQICDDHVGGLSCSKILLLDVSPTDYPAISRRVYVIFDDQSNSSMISPELVDDLGLVGPQETYTISTCTSDRESRYGRRVSGLIAQSVYGKSIELPPLLECDCIPKSTAEVATPDMALQFQHLRGIAKEIPEKDHAAQVMILIGRDAPELLKVRAFRNGPRGAPWAQKLSLGWTMSGQVCLDRVGGAAHIVTHKTSVSNTKTETSSQETYVVRCSNTINVRGNNVVYNDIFETNAGDTETGMSQEDLRFLTIMDQGFHINEAGNCEMPLPLRDLGDRRVDNRDQAERRLRTLQRTFKRKPQMESDYTEFMAKIFERGHADIITPDKKDDYPDNGKWYLPHFGVYNEKKPGQIRVVFDSAAESDGISLNKMLLPGPDQMNSLFGVLVRFRRDDIAVICDVEQMFHSFHVNPEHRDYLRFLWFRNNNPSDIIIECRMNVHIFGNNSSPSIATYGLRRAADLGEDQFGTATKDFVHSNFYVDDGLVSVPTEKEAEELIKNAQSMLKVRNLRLHKVASNSVVVMNSLPENDRAKGIRELDLTRDCLPSVRSLGVCWDLKDDKFTFKVDLPEKPFTRRGVLAVVNSVFDPLGMAAPVTIKGKQLMQELTTLKKGNKTSPVSWDEPLPSEKRKSWEEWRTDLANLSNIGTPRCYHPKHFGIVVRTELHAFADASKDALGVAIYIRQINSEGIVNVALVYGQAKVTPAKATTIPRLELCAAVLATQAVSKLQKELALDVDQIKFYTDSKIVLGYISNESRRFYVYVANRVQSIRNASDPNQWSYVETGKNPADIATRGIRTSHLMDSIWFTGPDFLYCQNITYSDEKKTTLDSDDPDVRKDITIYKTLTKTEVGLNTKRFERFSTWESAIRAISKLKAMARKYTSKSRSKNDENIASATDPGQPPTLCVNDLTDAEQLIITTTQYEQFGHEIDLLRQKKSIGSGESSIAKLDPFLDDSGVLRVGGRIRTTDLPFAERHPAILPKNHYVTKLIVSHHHEKVKHQGRVLTLGAVRNAGYWIVGGQILVGQVIKSCTTCRRLRGQPITQHMADLPADRVTPAPPFTNVGFDVFGPWVIHTRKTRGGTLDSKRWGLVFTCLVSRAIHIEVLESLDSSSFICALRRFFAIRGSATVLRCDNGTNFVGAKGELEEALSKADQLTVASYLKEQRCEWIFNPPAASHFGGVWERQILTIRRILDSILLKLGKTMLTNELLVTFMAEVTGIVNARPITAILSDASEPQLLTPAMLLTMKTRPFVPLPGVFVTQDLYAKKRWRQVQFLATQFWSRWRNEYLQNLQTRSKWNSRESNLRVGDVVIVTDDDAPQYKWPLGRIISTRQADDGLVREATVSFWKDGVRKELKRPLSKLVLLVTELD